MARSAAIEADAAEAKAAKAAASREATRKMTPVERAEEALALGDYAFAAEQFKEAFAAEPENSDLLWSYADAVARSGDTGAGLRAARKVLVADPSRVGVRTKMARWMDERGQLSSAVPLLEEERKLDSKNPKVLRMLAAAYGEAGQEAQAAEATEAWVAVAPDNPAALLALASLKIRKKDFAAAEELYTKIAALDPEGAHRMFFNAGASILNKPGAKSPEERKRAILAFEKTLELKPDYLRAHLLAGDTYLGLGDFAKAREHYLAYIKQAPADDPQVPKIKSMLEAIAEK